MPLGHTLFFSIIFYFGFDRFCEKWMILIYYIRHFAGSGPLPRYSRARSGRRAEATHYFLFFIFLKYYFLVLFVLVARIECAGANEEVRVPQHYRPPLFFFSFFFFFLLVSIAI